MTAYEISERRKYRNSFLIHAAIGLAGMAAGLFGDSPSAEGAKVNAIFEPKMDVTEREKLLNGWHAAVSTCRGV